MLLEFDTPPRSICILRLSAIGDTCHVVPVVRTLQTAWPNCEFVWIIGKLESTLLGDIPGIEFITFDKSAGLAAYSTLRRNLRERRFDLLLHMHPSMRANLVSLTVNAEIKLGFDRTRARDFQWLFTNRRITAQPHQHVMDGFFGFAEALGINERVLRWDIPLSEKDRSFAQQQLSNTHRAMVISPCSSQRFRNFRDWSVQNYAAVVKYAAERHGVASVITGGSSEREQTYAREICELAAAAAPLNLVGQTSLKQLLALIETACLVLCPDSGPAHMATAVGTPVLGLYATSNRFRTGPYLSQQWVVDRYPQAVRAELRRDVDEVAWGRRVRNPSAMELIDIEAVTARIDALLAPPVTSET